MMGSLSEDEDQFFDSREEITSLSDSSSECLEISDSDCGDNLLNSIRFDVWIKNLGSIRERRNKFLRWMGLSVDQNVGVDSCNEPSSELEVETDRMTEDSSAVLGSSSFEESSSLSLSSEWSNDAEVLSGRIRNLDNGTEFIVDETVQNGIGGWIREVGSNRLLSIDEFQRSLGMSPLVQRVMSRGLMEFSNLEAPKKQLKKGLLKRLAAVACVIDGLAEGGSTDYDKSSPIGMAASQLVRVRSYKKRWKEFSALYTRQDISAHEGSILTMKFSPDGQYLASAGEDGVVRVWQVMESERSDEFGILDNDLSHRYFMVNSSSELVPLHANKEKRSKLKSLRAKTNSACVIIPHKAFQISEKPIHEFFGHCGEVLDLSWSNNKRLLSSSVDKTVRQWQVGCNQCLQVFYHNDYVTCVHFNPVDDNHFISGSIDGKVRIWEVSGSQVVDWTGISEIVTAVCFRPDGKGVIVGCMSGTCRFYDASDNRLQLSSQICLLGKKKSAFKRITGFQFSPSDPTRLLVSSADSQVRILHGVDVICKYRGLRNAGSQVSACFTSDGMHIVSASDDSYIYVWNYISQEAPIHQVKKSWSSERFFSNNASVAIPWYGMTVGNSHLSDVSRASPSSIDLGQCSEERAVMQSEMGETSQCILPFASPDRFSLRHGCFSESSAKGSATWPEEKLASSSLVVSSAMCKSEYKFLKTSCQNSHGSPHSWGSVIVTAGWDGRIRSFQNYGLPVRR
ncbi:hypothetical protein K2173_025426 [Erythroxylum novogranatense]|uniref:Uncharacterized protein n=1 Tax=Erythroxylum novogranatense TaxID=1862640 RepID=A0AAV8UDT4_9ROSI|nr:hypothetical protein K2173_025426 [Erythroxylum novogranatense]